MDFLIAVAGPLNICERVSPFFTIFSRQDGAAGVDNSAVFSWAEFGAAPLSVSSCCVLSSGVSSWADSPPLLKPVSDLSVTPDTIAMAAVIANNRPRDI